MTIECQYLGFQCQQLGAESGNARARYFREPRVLCIGDNLEQPLDTIATDWRDDPELGKVRADRIDDRSLLTDEEMPGAMKGQTALLLGRLGRHEPHVWPGHRLANRFRVGGIVLLSLHIGLPVGRRHQPHGVAERLKFTRPMMRRRAGLDTNEAGRQLPKERQHISTLQLTAKYHLTIRVNAMNLKDRFRDIETDCRDRLHDLAPPNHRMP